MLHPIPKHREWARRVLTACTLVLLAAGTSGTEGQVAEYRLKAAFLAKFLKYVEWPSTPPEQPFVVGVLGRDPFGAELVRVLRDRRVGKRTVVVRRISDDSQAARVDLLFVPAREVRRMPRVIEATRGKAILIVGESEGFARRGGCINFYIQDKHLRFEINPREARARRLKIRADLLKLARIVKGD